MKARIAFCLSALLCLLPLSGRSADSVASPFYGVGLYQFFQDNYFSAIVNLEADEIRGRLSVDEADARLLMGGLYLGYGMHRHAETIFAELLDSEDLAVRDQAWLYLAKIRYQRGFEDEARQALIKIEGAVPAALMDDFTALQSLLLLGVGDEPVEWVFKESETGLDFARFNLALWTLEQGDEQDALAILNKLADQSVDNYTAAIFVDRVNLTLGEHYLAAEQFDLAQAHLLKVTLGGPFSNQALLGLGWAALGSGDPAQALAAWTELLGGQDSDPAVQEAYLAIPYLYFVNDKLDLALQHYQAATEFYADELASIEQVMSSDKVIALLAQLAEPDQALESGWRWQSEISPDASLDFYLVSLLTGHAFQEALKNYRDLRFIRDNLEKWRSELGVYQGMQALRKASYQQNLFEVTQYVAQQAPETSIGQTRAFAQQLGQIEKGSDEMALRRADEDAALQNISELRARSANIADRLPDYQGYQERLRILEGMLRWQVVTDYPQRLWNAKKQLKELKAALRDNQQHYSAIETATDGLALTFDQYGRRIDKHAAQIEQLSNKVAQTLTGLETHLQQMLVAEMQSIKARLEVYRSQALVSIAHIHDVQLERALVGNEVQPD